MLNIESEISLSKDNDFYKVRLLDLIFEVGPNKHVMTKLPSFTVPTKFQLHRLINNGDLLADRNRWKDRKTDTQTDRRLCGSIKNTEI